MSIKSLWGEMIDVTEVRAPHEILEEQGTVLADLTKGLLNMKIVRKQSSTVFNYDVYITMPSMNYKHRILRLIHDVKLYPAMLYDEQNSNEFRSKDADEFEENLGKILSSPDTKVIIGGLMVRARLNDKDVLV